MQFLYQGVLLSAYDPHEMKLEGLVNLPVMLARGTRIVRDKVHACLAALFSSTIQEMTFPVEDMLWMIAAWAGYLHETKTNKEVLFFYQVPLTKDSITCQYSVQFIKQLWTWSVTGIVKSSASVVNLCFILSSQHSRQEQTSCGL